MSRLLGEVLLRDGSITSTELDAALRAQRDRGGRLGTNLLESGLVGERTLGEALSRSLRVRYAPPEMIERREREVAGRLPRWLALKHRAVPLRVEEGALHLLVAAPSRLAGLSTRIGCRLTPWIAPWVRVSEALFRVYGVSLDDREAAVLERLQAAVPEPASPDEATGPGIRPETRGRETIGLALDAFSARLDHVVLFRVKQDVARIWDVRGPTLDRHALAGIELPVGSGSLLELLSVYPSYVGPVPGQPVYRVFFERLGIPRPREMFLAPIRVGRRDAGILYGDLGPQGTLRRRGGELLALSRKLTRTLTLLVDEARRTTHAKSGTPTVPVRDEARTAS